MNKTKKQNIAIFGSLTQDLFVYPENNITVSHTKENEEMKLYALPYGEKINARYLERHGGGGGGNIGISFQRLGFQSDIFGAVGDDDIASWILKKLENENISIKNIQIKQQCESGFSIILNSFDGERTVIYTSQANKEFSDSFSLEPDKYSALYLCHLSSIHAQKIRKKIQNYCNENSDVLFAWNPGNETLKEGLEKNKTLLSLCDIIFLNKEEAELFSQKKSVHMFSSVGEKKRNTSHLLHSKNIIKNIPAYASDCEPMAKKILEYGVKTVVITDGSKGAQIFTKNSSFFSPPLAKERKDSLGAGDGYASAFTASILHGKDLQSSAKYASMNAASVVSFRGAQDGLLSKSILYRK